MGLSKARKTRPQVERTIATTPPQNVLAWIAGPPVASCFGCDEVIPIQFVHWHGEVSVRGQILALLPYCEICTAGCERRHAIYRLEKALQRVETEGDSIEARAA
jgi:hypothetical protein